MYLDRHQLNLVLQTPFFTQPVTENVVDYVLYRGHLNAKVHTLRFNLIDGFDENRLIQHVLAYLMRHYKLQTKLLGSINYDLLLSEPNTGSSYIWRANSNSSFAGTGGSELYFELTYNNVYRFVRDAARIHVSDLDIYFRSSNVVVERILAIVISFVKI